MHIGSLVKLVYSLQGYTNFIVCPFSGCPTVYTKAGGLKHHLMDNHGLEKQASCGLATKAQNSAIEKGIENWQKHRPKQQLLNSMSTVEPNIHILPTPTIWPSSTCCYLQCIIFIDIETPNGFLFSNGAICQIALAHELYVNPAPYLQPIIVPHNKPGMWTTLNVGLNGITPSHVANAPSLKDTLESMYSYASVNFQMKEVIFVAHNSGFD